ncbi:MAG: lytic murein transglycosylase B [Gammaproteobacteria bacterium]
MVIAFAAIALTLIAGRAAAQALEAKKEIAPFADEVSKRHGIPRAEIVALLSQAKVSQRILDLMARPAEGKPWREYRAIFITEERIAGGVAFYKANAETLARAERVYGVSPEVIVAIIGVETYYGERAGTIRVLDALCTLAFRFPRRSAFFRKELESYVLLAREEGLPALEIKGSYAGAMGIPQFIPSSYRHFAVDFNDDRIRDLISSTDDAIGSVASYLAEHGWVNGGPVATPVTVTGDAYASIVRKGLKPATTKKRMRARGVTFTDDPASDDERAALLEYEGASGTEYWVGYANFYAITRYNHSQLYALAVHQLARSIRARL